MAELRRRKPDDESNLDDGKEGQNDNIDKGTPKHEPKIPSITNEATTADSSDHVNIYVY